MVFTVLLVDRNPARQCGGDTHVCIEHFLGLLWLTNFKDQSFPREIDALLNHRFLEVVDVHDSEVVRFDGTLQLECCLLHSFFGG
jgi:hypothetical protein